MAILALMKDTLDSGDPIVRGWFMVQSYWAPFLFCGLYLYFVKKLGPSLMRNRQPFDLRSLMIVYNLCIVATYTVCLLTLIYYFLTTNAYKYICFTTVVIEGHYSYTCCVAAWCIYILKYVEFADTVFFVLRKKDHLITNLHVIHHTVLPLISWILMRTETSGFQFIPGGINCFIHIIMYTYYALAAMGPEVQKKLWWKKYLTLLQMAQFIVILLFVFVIVPVSGCKTSKHGIYINMFFASLFLTLFYNFYTKTYKKSTNSSLQLKFINENGANGCRSAINGKFDKES